MPYWTNREAIVATQVPSPLVDLGGGAIGVELGQVFARFGSVYAYPSFHRAVEAAFGDLAS